MDELLCSLRSAGNAPETVRAAAQAALDLSTTH